MPTAQETYLMMMASHVRNLRRLANVQEDEKLREGARFVLKCKDYEEILQQPIRLWEETSPINWDGIEEEKEVIKRLIWFIITNSF